MVIWLDNQFESKMLDIIDIIVSVKLSDPTIDPICYSTICKYMLHGPCGALNKSAPCMLTIRSIWKFQIKF